jgi:hypothetical protein
MLPAAIERESRVELDKIETWGPAHLEFVKAEREYEALRQRILQERRENRRLGISQPPLLEVPELAAASADLREKWKAVRREERSPVVKK